MLLFSDLLIWLNLYDDQIACQCWCRQSANTWHTKLKSGASNLHGAGASNLQDNTIRNNMDWEARENPVTTGTKIDKGEPLIGEYNLTDWQDHTYSGLDPDKKFRPNPLKTSYRGLVRVASIITCRGTEDDENGEEGR